MIRVVINDGVVSENLLHQEGQSHFLIQDHGRKKKDFVAALFNFFGEAEGAADHQNQLSYTTVTEPGYVLRKLF